MKSLITNCNSNDQLLQLVSIQLLQKAYFIQLNMFECTNYFTVELLVLVAVQFLSGNFRVCSKADGRRGTQGSSSLSSAANATSYLSQYMTDLQLPVRNRSLFPTPSQACCCPTGGTGCYFCSSITGFGRKTFSVCGLLTKCTQS